MKSRLITACLIILCSFKIAASEKIDTFKMQKLENGEIIVKSVPVPGEGARFQAWAIFPESLNKVRDVLADFASYPNFMPDITNTVILSTKPDVVNYTLGLPMGIKKYYRLIHEMEERENEVELHWKQIPWNEVAQSDSIQDTYGLWRLSAIEPNKTLVFYDIYTNPGNVPFGFGWIVDYLSKESVPNVLNKTKTYLENRDFTK